MSVSDKRNLQPVKVYIRLRPFTQEEIDSKTHNIVRRLTPREITVKTKYVEKKFNFDHVFGENASQEEVYNVVINPMINDIIAGYNCTVFVFGQTGTGKTHTIIGPQVEDLGIDIDYDLSVGIIPRVANQLFIELNKLGSKTDYTVRASFIEIYNEEVRDLFNDCTPLRVFDTAIKGSAYMRNLTEHTVCTPEQMYDNLRFGLSERQPACKSNNMRSSRSHTIFTMLVAIEETSIAGEKTIKTSKIDFVDLAGSENICRSSTIDSRARDTATMNKSLLTLGKVMKAHAQKMQHIPHRESKLTKILQGSLGGNTKTCIIGTIAPGSNAFDETLNTLEYANIAKNIVNCPSPNISKTGKDISDALEKDISILKQELAAARSGEGFFVSTEAYREMSETLETSKRRIDELIEKITQMEEDKNIRETECEKLRQSFAETNAHLGKLTVELDEKNKRIAQGEEVLKSLDVREEQLDRTARLLLGVCEESTRREDIFREKYNTQCDATIANADIGKSMEELIIKSMKEIDKYLDINARNGNTLVKGIESSLKTMVDNQEIESNDLAVIADNMQLKAQNPQTLVVHDILMHPTINFTNVHDFFNDLFNENIEHLKIHRNAKNSIECLKGFVLTRQRRLNRYASKCNTYMVTSVDQTNSLYETTRSGLIEMDKIFDRSDTRVHEVMTKLETFGNNLDDFLDGLNVTRSEQIQHTSEIGSVVKEQLAQVKYLETTNFVADMKDILCEYSYYQHETGKQQKTLIDDVLINMNECQFKTHAQMVSARVRTHHYLHTLVNNLRNNLSYYNNCLHNIFREWMRNANLIKERMRTILTVGCREINENVELLAATHKTYSSDVKKVIKETTEGLTDLETKLIKEVHVGDTPVKKTYQYPKTIPDPLTPTRLFKLSDVAEETTEGQSTSKEDLKQE